MIIIIINDNKCNGTEICDSSPTSHNTEPCDSFINRSTRRTTPPFTNQYATEHRTSKPPPPQQQQLSSSKRSSTTATKPTTKTTTTTTTIMPEYGLSHVINIIIKQPPLPQRGLRRLYHKAGYYDTAYAAPPYNTAPRHSPHIIKISYILGFFASRLRLRGSREHHDPNAPPSVGDPLTSKSAETQRPYPSSISLITNIM